MSRREFSVNSLRGKIITISTFFWAGKVCAEVANHFDLELTFSEYQKARVVNDVIFIFYSEQIHFFCYSPKLGCNYSVKSQWIATTKKLRNTDIQGNWKVVKNIWKICRVWAMRTFNTAVEINTLRRGRFEKTRNA